MRGTLESGGEGWMRERLGEGEGQVLTGHEGTADVVSGDAG